MSTGLLAAPDYEADLWDDEDVLSGEEEASHKAPLDALQPVADDADEPDRLLFDLLADELVEATSGMSSTRRAARHPAYGEILALGDRAIPWLLLRLEEPGERPLWLRLLGALNRIQPGAGQETVAESAQAWIRWGKTRNAR
jgi:hypothetical protein